MSRSFRSDSIQKCGGEADLCRDERRSGGVKYLVDKQGSASYTPAEKISV